MSDARILVCGLPGSGKSTFLAALWHLLFSGEVETALCFDSLPGDRGHLNALAERWKKCSAIEHTPVGGEEIVTMNLRDGDNQITLALPDLSGESWKAMWESRLCPTEIASLVDFSDGILLFVHSDDIRKPIPVVEIMAQSRILGEQLETENEIPWSPSLAPTQAILVDILQMLTGPPLSSKSHHLAVIFSAWDLAEAEEETPDGYLAKNLPLLEQYLDCGTDFAQWKVFGVSAQGGDLPKDAAALLAKDKPSERIRVIEDHTESHDLTWPVKWLIG